MFFFQCFFPICFFSVNGNTDENNILIVLKLFIVFFDVRYFLSARATPASPKINNNHLAFK
ncbi:hypothetical protein EVA_10661 [gut metagenome]|uniref:Uncharacterized protein n=1 Tax=gut metagenome TaxID=749906 RepID=J9CMB2_9ZZZZ